MCFKLFTVLLFLAIKATNFHSSTHLRRVGFGLGQLKLIKHSSNRMSKIYRESIACIEYNVLKSNLNCQSSAQFKFWGQLAPMVLILVARAS